MRGHVDSETLAAFREELLPRRKAGQVAAHLSHCEQCAGLDAQLADLPGLLARTSAPPMPDALTARIEAALSAEAAARSALTPDGAPTEAAGTAVGAAGAAGAGATPTPGAAPTQPGDAAGHRGHRARPAWPGRGPGRSRLALRIAAAAAAIVVIAGGGYGVSRLVSGGGTGQASTASGAAAPAAKHAVASPELGPEHGSGSSGNKSRAAAVNPPEPAMLYSGTNYRTGQLKTQIEAALAPAGRAAPGPKPSHLVNGATALTSCLRHVAGNQRPLLVDMARYNGRPATIIVLTTASPKTRRVVVVGPGCSATQTDLITTTTIPAPH